MQAQQDAHDEETWDIIMPVISHYSAAGGCKRGKKTQQCARKGKKE